MSNTRSKMLAMSEKIARLTGEIERLTAESMCIWEDCDQQALYCEGHAHELVNPLGLDARKLQAALESIAHNTCCEGCQEAKRVALAALEGE